VLQLLVRRRRGHEKTFAVTGGQTADDAGACDGGADGGNDVLELCLEDTATKLSVCLLPVLPSRVGTDL
jgi:hypothetical protein